VGKRASALGTVLQEALGDSAAVARPDLESVVAAGLADEVFETYQRLGGVHDEPRVQPGPWDFQFEDVVVELDEENHFNRYRLATLYSPTYTIETFTGLDLYRGWCSSRESHCQTHGGYWANESSEREFGPPGEKGQLAGDGSPRWKQRAFYDYIKDLAPRAIGVPISRIAIWDVVSVDGDRSSVDGLLSSWATGSKPSSAEVEAITTLIESRRVAPEEPA
jgi:hypothetical protein